MFRRAVTLSFVATLFALGCAAPKQTPENPKTERRVEERSLPPRLVIWITIDQLPTKRFEERSKDARGAFSSLRTKGRFYSGARYAHANTETAPGHATLFTGTSPSDHGIVANEWWDYGLGRVVPSTLDASSPLLIGKSDPGKTGRSPKNLLEATLGDALDESDPDSRVFAVSLKDRGAIFPAGKFGKAFWFQEGGFTSSRHYFEKLPEYVGSAIPTGALEREWTLLDPRESYVSRERPRSSFAPDYLGPSFPHKPKEGATLEQILRASPLGDEATLELASSILATEELGVDEHPDLLAVSLSSNDYVSHFFGPESLEAEDLLRRTDVRLGEFLRKVYARVPENRVFVVLSSDHGGSESPEEVLRNHGRGGRVGVDAVKTALERSLTATKIERKVLAVVPPYVFLERKDEPPLDATVTRALEERLKRELPSLHALRSTGALEGDDELSKALRASVRPGVSGDLYIVFGPHEHFLQDDKMASTHGSPWDYDREVPIVLAGSGVKPGQIETPVFVHELAPSVAHLLGLTFRGGSRLPE